MFDQDFRDRLREHIGSVWVLELLLLLRSAPGRTWRVEALVQELRASDRIVLDGLASLQRSGLAAADGEGFRASGTDAATARFLDRLAEAFRVSPASLIRLIVEEAPPSGFTPRRSPAEARLRR